MEIKKSVFVKSAPKLMDCPKLDVPEFALIGRSNVGKSTLINMLTNNPGLAKASKVPGKTQLMNYFLIDDLWALVDLPGYGYAKSGVMDRVSWMDNLESFFKRRMELRRVFVLVDINLPPQTIDLEFMETLEHEQILFDIIGTKVDKTNQKELSKNLKLFTQELDKRLKNDHHMFLTSSSKKIGKQEILDYIEELINQPVISM